ncbi:MAG: ABC transporter permease [Candidatus Marinimicrobia bacterium]|jgi:putative ABC transport system permease protein|nr:ABC transporter permease [Candidatus Neomarinimicrobiota bacterium]
MGQLWESFIIAFKDVFANKTRSFLTMLGIIIGILSVSLMGTAISGINDTFENSMDMIGNDVLQVQRFPWFGGDDWWTYRNRPKMKEEYADKILQRSKNISFATTEMQNMGNIRYRDNSVQGVFIDAANWQLQHIKSFKLEDGRFYTKAEDRNASKVVVIGYGIKDNLFPNQNPIGEKIRIRGMKYKVIGTLKEQGKFLGLFSFDNMAIIPLKSAYPIFGRRRHMSVTLKVREGIDVSEAKEEVAMIMRSLRGLKPSEKDNFSINQQEAFREQFSAIKMGISGAGFGITALALLVGGIGIMNIMFVSVKERTKEIGIRKALGAKQNVILFQFLSEAVIIAVIGGMIGLIITTSLVGLLNKFFVASLSIQLVIISLSVSIITGVLSGIVPARKAAKLDPIDAIRYE